MRRTGPRRRRATQLAACLAVGLATCSLPGHAAGEAAAAKTQVGTLAFEPCTLSQAGLALTVAAQCSKLRVLEDRSRPDGRTIEIAVARIAGSARTSQPDPVVMLAGGPGQSALESFPQVAAAFRGVLRERDVILVDQRGTGSSHALHCPEAEAAATTDLMEPHVARQLTERCLREIETDADPRFYTTSDYVADLESVRSALAVPQFNLVGISYGTRVALEYLRRHPLRTRAVVLDSVVPPELILGGEHARNLEMAIDAQFARCEADPACHERFGSPRVQLDALLARLRAAPQRVTYRDPLTHESKSDTLTATDVAGVVRLYAYAPQLFGMLPMTLAAAAGGEYATLLAQARMIEQLLGEQISMALQLSVSCAEDAPWLKADPADAGTLLGTTFVDLLQAQCAVWPRGRVPPDFHEPLESQHAVLLFSGELDPVTPPRYGEAVRRTLPNSRHFTLNGQGHSVLAAGCAPKLMTDFIARGDASTLDGQCLERLIDPPPFGGAYGWEP
jgi:pimeloyl-ACP methyl ester carboxylesterase